ALRRDAVIAGENHDLDSLQLRQRAPLPGRQVTDCIFQPAERAEWLGQFRIARPRGAGGGGIRLGEICSSITDFGKSGVGRSHFLLIPQLRRCPPACYKAQIPQPQQTLMTEPGPDMADRPGPARRTRLNEVCAAFRLLSRLPLPGSPETDRGAAGAWAFPLVGSCAGLLGGA